MGVEKKNLNVFTIPENELREYLFIEEWIGSPPEFGEIKETELTDNGILFSFCFTKPWSSWKKFQGGKPAEVRAKVEDMGQKVMARAKAGEITYDEAYELFGQEIHNNGIDVYTMDEQDMFDIIHQMRFPSFAGSFFKLESWAEPGFRQKITKVELTNDGVEFTIVDTT